MAKVDIRMDTNKAKRLSQILIFGALAEYMALEGLYGKQPFTIFRDSLPNVMVAIAMLAAGAWITLAVVEKALKEDKKKTWEKVRERTYDEIIEYVGYIVVSAQLAIPKHGLTDEEKKEVDHINEIIRDKTPNYKQEGKIVAQAIGRLVNLFGKAETRNRMNNAFGNISDQLYESMIKSVYKDIKLYLDIFSRVLLPRVLNFSENDKLRVGLIDFESASNNYEKWVLTLDNPLWVKAGLGLKIDETLIVLLAAAANVYQYISDDIENVDE